MGWMFFYAGITKVLNPQWSAAGYLKSAKTLPSLYAWFASSDVLPVINFINKWGLVFLGVSLLLGIFVRLSSFFGGMLMVLYYLVVLNFPYVGEHSLIVDEHIIYIAGLCVLHCFAAGQGWGLDAWCSKLPLCSRYPKLRALLG